MFLICFNLWYVVSQIILVQLYAYNLFVAFSQSFLTRWGIWSIKHRASYQWVGGWREGDAAGCGEFQVEKSMRRIQSHKRPDQSFKHWEVPYCRMLGLFISYYKTGPGPLWSECSQPIFRNWTFKWTMMPSVRLLCHNNFTVTTLGHALRKIVGGACSGLWKLTNQWRVGFRWRALNCQRWCSNGQYERNIVCFEHLEHVKILL